MSPIRDSSREQLCRPEGATRELFRAHDLRCTRQRVLIYEALHASRAHPTADTLLDAVRLREPGLSLATVYNALDVFTEAGLVKRIASPRGNGPSRYDADMSAHVHITTPGGRIIDVPNELSDEIHTALGAGLLKRIEEQTGCRLAGVRVELIGVDEGIGE